jgi:hypothetical protein
MSQPVTPCSAASYCSYNSLNRLPSLANNIRTILDDAASTQLVHDRHDGEVVELGADDRLHQRVDVDVNAMRRMMS